MLFAGCACSYAVVLEETWHVAFSRGKVASPVAEVKSSWHRNACMMISKAVFRSTLKAWYCDSDCPLKLCWDVDEAQQNLLSPISYKG